MIKRTLAVLVAAVILLLYLLVVLAVQRSVQQVMVLPVEEPQALSMVLQTAQLAIVVQLETAIAVPVAAILRNQRSQADQGAMCRA